jgi:hypothetical protein
MTTLLSEEMRTEIRIGSHTILLDAKHDLGHLIGVAKEPLDERSLVRSSERQADKPFASTEQQLEKRLLPFACFQNSSQWLSCAVATYRDWLLFDP